MKKILLHLITITLLGCFSSCKKDHLCGCVVTSTDPAITRSVVYYTITDSRKSDAKKACIKTTRNKDSSGQTYVETFDCALKD